MVYRIEVEPSEELKELKVRPSCKNVQWALRPLIGWMRWHGLSPQPVSAPLECKTRWISRSSRLVFFSTVLCLQMWLCVNISLNANSVAMAYTNGYSTGAVAWNFTIDAFNFSFYVVFNYGVLLYLTRSKPWNNIVECFKRLEDNFTSEDIYLKCRKFSINLSVYVIVMVRNI